MPSSNRKPHPTYPQYSVGDDGTVQGPSGRILKPFRFKDTGYEVIGIWRPLSKKTKQYKVHRIVLETFVGFRPEGLQAAHGNGIRHDNRLSNLSWATPKKNAEDKIQHGTDPKGTRAGNSKLTDEQVLEIRRLNADDGVNQYQLADMYEVSQGTIGFIVRRETWTHI